MKNILIDNQSFTLHPRALQSSFIVWQCACKVIYSSYSPPRTKISSMNVLESYKEQNTGNGSDHSVIHVIKIIEKFFFKWKWLLRFLFLFEQTYVMVNQHKCYGKHYNLLWQTIKNQGLHTFNLSVSFSEQNSMNKSVIYKKQWCWFRVWLGELSQKRGKGVNPLLSSTKVKGVKNVLDCKNIFRYYYKTHRNICI